MIERILREHKAELREGYGVREIGLSGSYVRSEQRRRSDVDILVEFDTVPGLLKFIELEDYLSRLLGVRVDLVRRASIRKELRERILSENGAPQRGYPQRRCTAMKKWASLCKLLLALLALWLLLEAIVRIYVEAPLASDFYGSIPRTEVAVFQARYGVQTVSGPGWVHLGWIANPEAETYRIERRAATGWQAIGQAQFGSFPSCGAAKAAPSASGACPSAATKPHCWMRLKPGLQETPLRSSYHVSPENGNYSSSPPGMDIISMTTQSFRTQRATGGWWVSPPLLTAIITRKSTLPSL